MQPLLTFRLRGQTYSAATIAALSAIYCALRDRSGEGASTFPTPTIKERGKPVAKFSYNGKVWGMQDWQLGTAPLYDPYRAEA